MNISTLRNFVIVVDQGNVSKAADVVRIAQPALSRQLRALEEELGVQLLTRHSWGVAPTKAGEILAFSARRILNDLAGIKMEVRAADQEPAGVVSIGATPSLAAALFSPLASRILEKFPKIRLSLFDRMSSDLSNELNHGRLDMAVVQKNRALAGLQTDHLLTEAVGLVAAPHLVAKAGPITWETFQAVPLILPTAPSDTRSALDIAFGDAEIHIAVEVYSLQAMLRMAAEGLGFAMLTKSASNAMVRTGELAFAPLHFSWPDREVVIARASHQTYGRAALVVYDELKMLVAESAEKYEWQLP